MQLPQLQWQTWVMIGVVGLIIGAGIWAFGVGKPARVSEIEIGLRLIDDQRAEIGLRETSHEGLVYVYETDGAILDYTLVNRPRSLSTDPIVLSNDTRNAPSQARVTVRGLSDDDVKLGLRMLRPNRRWDSTRFPRAEPIRLEELSADEWFYYSPIQVRVTYHQPLVDVVRLFVYIAGAFGVLLGLSWIVWRRWLS